MPAPRVSHTRSLSFDGRKWAPFFTLIFGPPRTTALCRSDKSDRQVLEESGSPFSVLLSFFSLGLIIMRSVFLFLLLLAFLTAAFSIAMGKRKVTAEELLAQAESNGY